MPAEQVTILIPDISGYTEFVSKTEIDHSAHILNHLLETIIKSIGEEYVVAEIEGDAVLLYKKGNPPTKKELIEQCVKTFNAFHTQIKGMDNIRICQCVACSGFIKLSLKFIVHFGTISENTVSRFVKASGIDMIIAHRLLKNNIAYPEYLLITENYLKNIPDGDESLDLLWSKSNEVYSSIGTVEFDFTPLDLFKNLVPDIPKTEAIVLQDDSLPMEIEIESNYKEVFAVLIDLESRKHYISGVKDVKYLLPMAVIGMKFDLIFEEFKIETEPMKMDMKEEEIRYAEYGRNPQMNLYSVFHITLIKLGNGECKCISQIYPEQGHDLSMDQRQFLSHLLEDSMKNLKSFVENGSQF